MDFQAAFILLFFFLGTFISNALAFASPLWWLLAGPLDFLVILMLIAVIINEEIEKMKNYKPDYRGTTDFHSWGRKTRFKK